jgi:hypothetical protein
MKKLLTINNAIITILFIATIILGVLYWNKTDSVSQSLGGGEIVEDVKTDVKPSVKPPEYYTAKTESIGGVALTGQEYDLKVTELKSKLEYSMVVKEEPEVAQVEGEEKLIDPADEKALTNNDFEQILEVANKKCQHLDKVEGDILTALLNCL